MLEKVLPGILSLRLFNKYKTRAMKKLPYLLSLLLLVSCVGDDPGQEEPEGKYEFKEISYWIAEEDGYTTSIEQHRSFTFSNDTDNPIPIGVPVEEDKIYKYFFAADQRAIIPNAQRWDETEVEMPDLFRMLDIAWHWAGSLKPAPYTYMQSDLSTPISIIEDTLSFNIPAHGTLFLILEREIFNITVSYRITFTNTITGEEISETGKWIGECTGSTFAKLTRESDGQTVPINEG